MATFLRSCARPAPGWQDACNAARRLPQGDEAAARAFVLGHLRPEPAAPAFVTGYYEPEVAGSRVADPAFPVPVLRVPPNPGQYDRAQLLDGALAGQGLEIAFLRSVADLWLVQLQGAARIRLPDGGLLRLAHAGENGRQALTPLQLFGDADITRNDLSGPGIRAWMAARPAAAEARIRRDPNYTFFRVNPAPPDQGTIGASGAALTPLRSVGVDTRAIPLGTPLWLEVDTPGGKLRRLMVAQDTGGLVQGPGHLDLFFGWGPRAELAGGRQHAQGRMWLLAPRATPP